jgi:hydrogenase nickel incorporation protein HypA/HybF
MHELAICQSLLTQVLAGAASRGRRPVGHIALSIGPLAGIEIALLCAAFPLVAAGTLCDGAEIEIKEMPVRVHCPACNATSGALPNRLLCAACGAWRVRLISGDEMLLTGFEFRASARAEGLIANESEVVNV